MILVFGVKLKNTIRKVNKKGLFNVVFLKKRLLCGKHGDGQSKFKFHIFVEHQEGSNTHQSLPKVYPKK